MTTSPAMSFLKEIKEGEQIPEGEKAYFRERLRNRLYDMIVGEYARQHASANLTQAEVARRLGRSPEQISRWLGAPGNWTTDTVSDLLLAIAAAELEIGIRPLEASRPRNRIGPSWLMMPPSPLPPVESPQPPAGFITSGETITPKQMVMKITKPGFPIPPMAEDATDRQVMS